MKTHRLGYGCGTWEAILTCYNRGPKGTRPNFERRDLYEKLAMAGIMARERNDYTYRATDTGKEMAEWLMCVSQSPNVRIRFKRVPSWL